MKLIPATGTILTQVKTMSKFSNLYDIDGNIINSAPQHNFTIEETEKLVDDLTKKVQENPDNEVYKVYLNNAQKWLFKLYNEMSREDLMKRMTILNDTIQQAKTEASEAEKAQIDEVSKAMEELKEAYDKENAEEEQQVEDPEVINQDDLLTDRAEEAPVMDEYVQFEEAA